VHGAVLLAQLRGIDVRERAQALKGCDLFVRRSEFPPSAKDQYYWVDLIGCQVVNPADVALGVVEQVQEYGADPVLAVRGPDGQRRLIPFVQRHVLNVDLAARRILADWDLDF
jgi:16S rRNA processing protein RimM